MSVPSDPLRSNLPGASYAELSPRREPAHLFFGWVLVLDSIAERMQPWFEE
jgi:hypothetical protein